MALWLLANKPLSLTTTNDQYSLDQLFNHVIDFISLMFKNGILQSIEIFEKLCIWRQVTNHMKMAFAACNVELIIILLYY